MNTADCDLYNTTHKDTCAQHTHVAVSPFLLALLPGEEDELGAILLEPLDIGLKGLH